MLLQPGSFESDEHEGYVPLKLLYNHETGQFTAEKLELSKKEKAELHIKDTKPFTLRSVAAKAVSHDNSLYIMHSLMPRNADQPISFQKHPVRVMNFDTGFLHTVDYANDLSAGNKRGEEKEERDTILPLRYRVNYSIACHKHRCYIYGGLDENNKLVGEMETYELPNYKFAPVKYRGDSKP